MVVKQTKIHMFCLKGSFAVYLSSLHQPTQTCHCEAWKVRRCVCVCVYAPAALQHSDEVIFK